jgi:recombinational DNA repair ATPase RecF
LLKLATTQYIETTAGTRTLLLLDDSASELDAHHVLHFVEHMGERPFFLTGHRIPESFFDSTVKTIDLSSISSQGEPDSATV